MRFVILKIFTLNLIYINHLNGGINQNKIYSLERGDIASTSNPLILSYPY